MADLSLRGICKSFGHKQVLKDVDFYAKSGELVALLGPSGCGKTTLLNIISGIVRQDAGNVLVEDRDIGDVAVEKRNIGMVFQNYALFDHLSVEQNVAYGLKIRRTPKAEIEKKVEQTLEMVGLPGTQKRRIHSLSGGEQQRIALARAIVLRPDLLLLDEPLSALDKKIREKMQAEIQRIQRETGITTLFVTHDQSEALAMADKIAIMREGRIVDMGTPGEIYNHPKSDFSASFLGTSNVFSGSYRAEDRVFAGEGFELPAPGAEFADGARLIALVKEENVAVSKERGAYPGRIEEKLFLGQIVRFKIRLEFAVVSAVTMSRQAELKVGDEVGVDLLEPSLFETCEREDEDR